MALADLRRRLRAGLDFNPDLNAWKGRELDELNDALIDICISGEWLFLQADAYFTTSAAVQGSSSATALVTNGSYAVVFTGASPTSTWEGQTFVGPDGAYYEIARVGTAGLGSAGTIWLMTPYAGDTAAAATSWAVRFLAYALPADCDEPLQFIDQVTYLPVPFINRAQDARRGYRPTNAGAALLVVDTVQKTDRAPDFAPTLAVNGSGDNSLAASTKYEVCYTFTMAGRESPPSPIATATTTVSNKTIAVSGMENTKDGVLQTGWYKNVYIRNATADGRWLQYATGTLQEAATTATLDNLADISTKDFNELRPQEPFRQYVRTDPPASEARTYQIRYKKRVRPMVALNDVPPIPPPFDVLIVYTALRRICLSIGADGLWKNWSAEADTLMRKMAAKHLDRQATVHRRESATTGIDGPGRVAPWIEGLTAVYTG